MTDSARTEEIRARVDFDNANEVAIAAASAIERETGYINLEGVMLHDAAMIIEEYAEQRVKKAVTALREEVERLLFALQRYGEHRTICQLLVGGPCSCGLSAALSPSPAQQEQK